MFDGVDDPFINEFGVENDIVNEFSEEKENESLTVYVETEENPVERVSAPND
ncbi:hypothetical protein SK128_016801, partial [Halocaridina rubra]